MEFQRGQVFEGQFPDLKYDEVLTPRPSFVLVGKHKFIMMNDHKNPDINPNLVMAIPITSARAEVAKAQKEGRSILASYVPLSKEDHPFLDHDSYASLTQMVPMSRKWFYDDPLGKIKEEKMLEIDFQLIRTEGLGKAVETMIETYVASKLQELQEAAAGKEAT
ncbi:type II toxin-antitoxin system PemK/MazF family toxin [Paenibacillus dendritiformis]|uniref:type II toxin-antitoxin system PemK/MazF family toxin n=1 Tax=Paenibacillus dendritiformis TaxID=130049 RepID=UPI000DAA5F7B|nr:type II toxin-antitoxin system PemK/MazF family toxin [Paenibacillus dendritiformis]PZM63718.1 PemK-like protein [Paenibacillus dendritiformis]